VSGSGGRVGRDGNSGAERVTVPVVGGAFSQVRAGGRVGRDGKHGNFENYAMNRRGWRVIKVKKKSVETNNRRVTIPTVPGMALTCGNRLKLPAPVTVPVSVHAVEEALEQLSEHSGGPKNPADSRLRAAPAALTHERSAK